MTTDYDVIVIGSGMGGMTTAAALSRFGHKVLVLEQAATIGGLTHAFTRNGFSWDVGLHYCGTFGPEQSSGKIIEWLGDGTIEFSPIGPVYDTFHFPGEFEMEVTSPGDALRSTLKDRFRGHAGEIDAYFDALRCAEEAMTHVAAERSMPGPIRSAHRWWNKKTIDKWCARTTAEVIGEVVSDNKLAAVLSAQWGTYGGKPSEASFAVHARVISHYLEGAAYPVGGAGAIARGLVPAVVEAGGKFEAGKPVEEILVEDGSAIGVRTRDGDTFRSKAVVSAIGAGETVRHLLPETFKRQDWVQEILSFRPSVCHFQLFLGFEGFIAEFGATRANHWFYERWDVSDAVWKDVHNDPIPMMFVSFPSLKDPTHEPGPHNKHTGEMLVWSDWSTVSDFAGGGDQERPAEWAAFKESVADKLMGFFTAKFPALAPFVVHRELGTPLATVSFTGHEKGGFYGVETTPRRVLSDALNVRTPVPGLFLSGQDVMTPGIAGALWGGLLCAAAIEPRVFQKFS